MPIEDIISDLPDVSRRKLVRESIRSGRPVADLVKGLVLTASERFGDIEAPPLAMSPRPKEGEDQLPNEDDEGGGADAEGPAGKIDTQGD